MVGIFHLFCLSFSLCVSNCNGFFSRSLRKTVASVFPPTHLLRLCLSQRRIWVMILLSWEQCYPYSRPVPCMMDTSGLLAVFPRVPCEPCGEEPASRKLPSQLSPKGFCKAYPTFCLCSLKPSAAYFLTAFTCVCPRATVFISYSLQKLP